MTDARKRELSDEQRRGRFWTLHRIAYERGLDDIDLVRWEEVCPSCGLEIDTWGSAEHTKDCPRVGTCGQCFPYLDPPWHPDDQPWSIDFDRKHRREHANA